MLSFMRDQQDASQAPAAKTQGTADPAAQAESHEYLTVAGKTQRTRQSTLLVIIMFVIGLVAVVVMVKKSQPKAAAAAPAKSEESQIEAAISRLTGVSAEMNTRMDQIVDKFHEFSAVVQVAVDELAKNPFELQSGEAPAQVAQPVASQEPPASPATTMEVHVQSTAPAPVPVETPEQAAARVAAEEAQRREAEKAKLVSLTKAQEEAKRREAEEAKRLAAEEAKRKALEDAKRREAEQAQQQYQQQVKTKASSLKLQSIIQTTGDSRCLIDDTLVRTGDRIKGFLVTQISDNSVHLLWSEPPMPDMKIVLKLSE